MMRAISSANNFLLGPLLSFGTNKINAIFSQVRLLDSISNWKNNQNQPDPRRNIRLTGGGNVTEIKPVPNFLRGIGLDNDPVKNDKGKDVRFKCYINACLCAIAEDVTKTLKTQLDGNKPDGKELGEVKLISQKITKMIDDGNVNKEDRREMSQLRDSILNNLSQRFQNKKYALGVHESAEELLHDIMNLLGVEMEQKYAMKWASTTTCKACGNIIKTENSTLFLTPVQDDCSEIALGKSRDIYASADKGCSKCKSTNWIGHDVMQGDLPERLILSRELFIRSKINQKQLENAKKLEQLEEEGTEDQEELTYGDLPIPRTFNQQIIVKTSSSPSIYKLKSALIYFGGGDSGHWTCVIRKGSKYLYLDDDELMNGEISWWLLHQKIKTGEGFMSCAIYEKSNEKPGTLSPRKGIQNLERQLKPVNNGPMAEGRHFQNRTDAKSWENLRTFTLCIAIKDAKKIFAKQPKTAAAPCDSALVKKAFPKMVGMPYTGYSDGSEELRIDFAKKTDLYEAYDACFKAVEEGQWEKNVTYHFLKANPERGGLRNNEVPYRITLDGIEAATEQEACVSTEILLLNAIRDLKRDQTLTIGDYVETPLQTFKKNDFENTYVVAVVCRAKKVAEAVIAYMDKEFPHVKTSGNGPLKLCYTCRSRGHSQEQCPTALVQVFRHKGAISRMMREKIKRDTGCSRITAGNASEDAPAKPWAILYFNSYEDRTNAIPIIQHLIDIGIITDATLWDQLPSGCFLCGECVQYTTKNGTSKSRPAHKAADCPHATRSAQNGKLIIEQSLRRQTTPHESGKMDDEQTAETQQTCPSSDKLFSEQAPKQEKRRSQKRRRPKREKNLKQTESEETSGDESTSGKKSPKKKHKTQGENKPERSISAVAAELINNISIRENEKQPSTLDSSRTEAKTEPHSSATLSSHAGPEEKRHEAQEKTSKETATQSKTDTTADQAETSQQTQTQTLTTKTHPDGALAKTSSSSYKKARRTRSSRSNRAQNPLYKRLSRSGGSRTASLEIETKPSTPGTLPIATLAHVAEISKQSSPVAITTLQQHERQVDNAQLMQTDETATSTRDINPATTSNMANMSDSENEADNDDATDKTTDSDDDVPMKQNRSHRRA